jgi:Alpha/beta hydrolase of unknown function (DUF1400)
MNLKLVRLRPALLLMAILSGILVSSLPAEAAEQVVLKYRVLRESLAVKDLSTFAQTGTLSMKLRVYLALAQQDPKRIRQNLTAPVKVNSLILDRVLNSPVGNIVLDQISQFVHTPDRKADRQALRSALVLSANNDGQISLIEIIQNYPASDVEVDGDKLESAYRQLQRLQGSLQNIFSF